MTTEQPLNRSNIISSYLNGVFTPVNFHNGEVNVTMYDPDAYPNKNDVIKIRKYSIVKQQDVINNPNLYTVESIGLYKSIATYKKYSMPDDKVYIVNFFYEDADFPEVITSEEEELINYSDYIQ